MLVLLRKATEADGSAGHRAPSGLLPCPKHKVVLPVKKNAHAGHTAGDDRRGGPRRRWRGQRGGVHPHHAQDQPLLRSRCPVCCRPSQRVPESRKLWQRGQHCGRPASWGPHSPASAWWPVSKAAALGKRAAQLAAAATARACWCLVPAVSAHWALPSAALHSGCGAAPEGPQRVIRFCVLCMCCRFLSVKEQVWGFAGHVKLAHHVVQLRARVW